MKTVEIYQIEEGSLPNLQYHVFISKTTTRQLAQFIEKEDWGNDNILLYKYLDYIWRFQYIDNQIKIFKHKNENRLIFHTGLIKRNTTDDVFICLVPNKQFMGKKVIQSWRVPFTSGVENNDSFLTKKQLIKLYKINKNDVPIKTNFYKNKNDSIFHPNYKFIINLDERVRTTKQRILNTIKNDTGFVLKDDVVTTKILKQLINDGINVSLHKVRKNGDLIGRQAFIERNIVNNKKYTIGYHLELLLPLCLPIYGQNIYFAMILRANHNNKTYEGMSIITREMAYSNARLIDQVKTPWLKGFVNTNIKSIPNNTVSDPLKKNNIRRNTKNIHYLKAMQYFMFGTDNVGLFQLNIQPLT